MNRWEILHVYEPKEFSYSVFAVHFTSLSIPNANWVVTRSRNAGGKFAKMPGKNFMVPWLQTLIYFSKYEDFSDTNLTGQAEFQNQVSFVISQVKFIVDGMNLWIYARSGCKLKERLFKCCTDKKISIFWVYVACRPSVLHFSCNHPVRCCDYDQFSDLYINNQFSYMFHTNVLYPVN